MSVSGKTVLVAVPTGILSQYGAGNWKDIQGQLLLLEDLGVPFRVHEFDDYDQATIIDQCTPDITDLIIHYTRWPEVISAVRQKRPAVSIHVRAHNAEAWQYWHRASFSWVPNYRNLRTVYGVVRLWWRDMQCRIRADTILGISPWDNRHYWQRMLGKATVADQTYYCPWPRLVPDILPLPWHSRDRTIICMPAGRDALGRSMITGLQQMASAEPAGSADSRWRICLSRGSLRNPDDPSANQQTESGFELLAGDVHPWRLLCTNRAVAVLTPLGFGMKTTVVDALAAGCHVLVHPVLGRRLPPEVRDNCIIVDPARHEEVRRAWELLEHAPAPHHVNDLLRSEAVKALRHSVCEREPNRNSFGRSGVECATAGPQSPIDPRPD